MLCVLSYWLELRSIYSSIDCLTDWSIRRWLIDWLVDRLVDPSIDWLVVGWLALVVHSFGLACWFYLRTWALWPVRVSVGPSWFCRADFSDGNVQKLSAIWAGLEVTEEYSLEPWAKRIEQTKIVRESVWPCGTWSPLFGLVGDIILYHGPNICIDLACPCRPSEQVCTKASKMQNRAPIYS